MNSSEQEMRETYEGLVGGNVSSNEAVRLIAREEGMTAAQVRSILGMSAGRPDLSSVDWQGLHDRLVTNRPREGLLAMMHPLNWGWMRQVFFVLIVIGLLKSIVTLDGELFFSGILWWLILAFGPVLLARWKTSKQAKLDSMTPEQRRQAEIERLRGKVRSALVSAGACRGRGDYATAGMFESQAREAESALRELGA